MTENEALDYIAEHPERFKGEPLATVLRKMQSKNDPSYYSPSLYVAPDPPKKPTAKKPAPVPAHTPTAPASVSSRLTVAPSGGALWGVPKSIWLIGAVGGGLVALHGLAKRRYA